MLNQILSAVLNVLAILGVIAPQVMTAAKEHFQYIIETAVLNIDTRLQDGTSGLAAMASANATYAGGINTKLDALAAQITAYTPVPTVVSLPVIPPAGYGGGATAAAIWGYTIPLTTISAEDSLAAATAPGLIQAYAESMVPVWFPGGWSFGGDWGVSNQVMPNVNFPPPLDPSTILVTDLTPLAWVNRVQPTYTVTSDDSGRPTTYQTGSSWDWTYFMGFAEFADYKAATFGGSLPVLNVAPVWPGLALVTLGTPVAITTAFTIAVPLHGVIVNLTAEPSKSSFYSFDGVNSYRNLGALSFTTDDGEQEASTSLGFTSGIYTPKTMGQASGVKVRTVGGVAGTVTPWVIT